MNAKLTFLPLVIACPSCPKCGTRMMLTYIVPDQEVCERRIYECPRCEHEVTETIRYRGRARTLGKDKSPPGTPGCR